MRILYLFAGLALAGCAAPYTWEHPGLDPVAAERQGEIDSAECTALAMQEVALPSEPAQTTVNVSVNGSGQPVDGYSHPTMTGSEAQAEAIRTAALQQAQAERHALANACMLRRGWVKVKRGEQGNVASAPVG